MISTRGMGRLKLVRYLTCSQMRWLSARSTIRCGSARTAKPGATEVTFVEIRALAAPKAGVAKTSPRQNKRIDFMRGGMSRTGHSMAFLSPTMNDVNGKESKDVHKLCTGPTTRAVRRAQLVL